MIRRFLFFIFTAIVLSSCGAAGSGSMTKEEMLELAGRVKLPTQEEYPDDGAVILYERKNVQFFLDDDWNRNVRTTYSIALVYFNEKADDWLTHSIYLNDDIQLNHFSARTIKPNGKVVELTEKDLMPAYLAPEFVEFSDEKSLKFTFPSVEKGAILEFTIEKLDKGRFYGGDTWYIQSDIPKLYTEYSIEIPDIFVSNNIGWNIRPVNITLPKPNVMKNVVNQGSFKDKSKVYWWVVRNVPAFDPEPNSLPYRDIAQYARIGVKFENWNELTEDYWEIIKDKFNPELHPAILKKAKELSEGKKTDEEKIKAVFDYVQKDFRYVAISVGESGYIPHDPEDILKNKYGDCKDMTVLNVSLLKAMGIDAKPVLVNTRDRGETLTDLVAYDFNHMIALAEANGKKYWLDATGSSCPLGEIYPAIEGVSALVIREDGTCGFMKIPVSSYRENKIVRELKINIDNKQNVSGKVKLSFYGNENISIRSELHSSNSEDIREAIISYVNRNTPGIEIGEVQHDDPKEISDSFTIEFDFHKSGFGARSGGLLIFRPSVFTLSSRLDKFKEKRRDYDIVFSSPYSIIDEVEIHYNPERFVLKAKPVTVRKSYSFAKLSSVCADLIDGEISYRREFILKNNVIPALKYQYFLDIHKAIAEIEEETIVLERKSSL